MDAHQSSPTPAPASRGVRAIKLSLLFTLLSTAHIAAAQGRTDIAGTLLGHDGRPMPEAHVHLKRFGQSKPLASAAAGPGGRFRIGTNETGLFVLQLAGVNHESHGLTLLLDGPARVGLSVRLKANDYVTDFKDVKIIGDFNDFSFKSARPMEKRPDGTFVAEFETAAGRFAYQLVGLRKGGGSVNGTQSEGYDYDGGGDYRSVVTPRGGRARIVFDPKLLVRSDAPRRIVFAKPRSTAARFAAVYDEMLKRRDRFSEVIRAYRKTGRPLEQFRYDWSPDLNALARQIAAEKVPAIRQALLLSYLDLGYGTFGAKVEPALARRALAEIPPTSPLWSIEPYLIGVAINGTGDAAGYGAYAQQVADSHADQRVARIARAEYAPSRAIMVGKPAPAFSLRSLDDPQTLYTSGGLKGKTLLIDFWATWCVPCLEEMPNLHKTYEKYKDRGFEILSVSLDERPGLVAEFRRDKWRMPWLHVLADANAGVKNLFEVVGIPKAVLIDPAGRIAATEKQLRGRNLGETLERVMGGKE
jgi:thiol-disulfide isomerase/thioredoxin